MKSKTQFTVKPLVTAILLLAFSTASAAIRLGEPVVISKIGEPFKVEIPVIDATPAMLSSLSVKIANSKAYADAHVDEPTWINTANIELMHGDGYPKVIVSAGPQTEAIVDLILELRTLEGATLQALPVVLDPVEGVYQITPIALNVRNNKNSQPLGDSEIQLRNKRDANTSEDDKDIKVKKGDNLSALVSNMVTKETSLDQLLVAYTKANPHAFANGNMNKLKAGVILKAPSKSEIEEIGQKQAKQIVAMHSTNFTKYAGAIAAITENAQSQNDKQATRTAKGKIQAKVNEQSQIATSQDKLMLSTASKKQRDGTEDTTKKGVLSEEEKIAQKIQIQEAHRRIAELEEVIAAHQKLVELENSAMAQAQNSAQQNKDLPRSSESAQVPEIPKNEQSGLSNDYPVKTVIGGALLGLIALVMWTRRRKVIDANMHLPSDYKAEYPMQTSAYSQPLEEQSASTIILVKNGADNNLEGTRHTMANVVAQDTSINIHTDFETVHEQTLEKVESTVDSIEPAPIPDANSYTSMLNDIPELSIVFTQENQAEDDVFVFDGTTLSIESVVAGSDFDSLNLTSATMLTTGPNSAELKVTENHTEVIAELTTSSENSTINTNDSVEDDSVPLNFLDSNMNSSDSRDTDSLQNVTVEISNEAPLSEEASTVTLQTVSSVVSEAISNEAAQPRSSKLALAKLHLQLGDIADAREVLMEMYISGTSEEKKIAMEILAKLDQQP